MKIEAKEVLTIQGLLKQELEKGNRFHVYDTGQQQLKPEQLTGQTYADKGVAMLFAHVHQEEAKREHLVLPIAEIYWRLNRFMELQSLTDPKGLRSADVQIDEQFLKKKEEAREEIYLSELNRQMTFRGFIPHNGKEVAHHLELDSLHFTISGVHQLQGLKAVPYQVSITQDKDRAFHITGYAPQLEVRLGQIESRMKELIPDFGNHDNKKTLKLIDDLHVLYLQGPEAQKEVKKLIDKYWSQGPMKDSVDPFFVIPKQQASEDLLLKTEKVLISHNINMSTAILENANVLSALAQGFYQKMPIRQTIVPEEQIDRFLVLTQFSPKNSIPEHTSKEEGGFLHFESGYYRLQDLHNVNDDTNKKQLLVGLFKDKEMAYNVDGTIKEGTAILLFEAGWKASGPEVIDPYLRKVNDLYQPYTFRTEVIVRFDPDSRVLKFYDDNFQPLKYMTMNEKNEEYLQKQLKWVGFGDHLNQELKAKLKEGNADFVLTHFTKFGKDEVAAVLNFTKSKDRDMVFFNRYQVAMRPEGKSEEIKQTFYIHDKEDNITLKEAYNQLSGRAVYKEMSPKEGDKYMAWEQLDFKETDKYGNFKTRQFNQNYGYDLAETLAKYPIKELTHADATDRLMDSLQRGNRQQVTLMAGDKEQKIGIEAAPQWKSLNFYDESGKRQDITKVLDGLKAGQASPAQEVLEQKNGTSQKTSPLDDEGAPAKKQGRKKRQSI